jgi:hypothetical protein
MSILENDIQSLGAEISSQGGRQVRSRRKIFFYGVNKA